MKFESIKSEKKRITMGTTSRLGKIQAKLTKNEQVNHAKQVTETKQM